MNPSSSSRTKDQHEGRRRNVTPATPSSPSSSTPAARLTQVQGRDRTMLARCLIFVGKCTELLLKVRVSRLRLGSKWIAIESGLGSSWLEDHRKRVNVLCSGSSNLCSVIDRCLGGSFYDRTVNLLKPRVLKPNCCLSKCR